MITNSVDLRRAPDPAAASRSSEIARFFASAMLGLFLITTLTVPVAFANKAIFVMLFVLMLIALVASKGRVRVRSLSPIIILAIFLYGYALAFVGTTDPDLTNQLMLSVAVLMLIYLIDWYAIDFEYLVKLSGVVLCLFTAFSIYAVTIVPDSALGGYFIDYFREYTNANSGERSFSENPLFMFRIGPVSFLFVPYCLFFDSFLKTRRVRDLLALILLSVVIVISASRALIMVSMLASAYLVVRRMRPTRQVISLCVGVGLGIFLVAYLMARTTLFSAADQSNSMKIGHVTSFVEHMNPARLFFGEGLAATYFSIGNNAVVPQTEITLLDMVRYFGLPLTALLYAALLFPTPRRSCYTRDNRTAVVLFLLYLLIALTNPVLFNSYGLVVVIWYWSRILAAGPNQERLADSSRSGTA
jgi:multisubunit Na+/H+ antiporter MnhB subunit